MLQKILLSIVITVFSSVVIAVDISVGKTKSAACVECHSGDGNSTVSLWPKIAGQHKKYLIDSLKEYRKGQDGERFDPVMYSSVIDLSDEDIADLAEYFASQKTSPGEADPELVELGAQIYRGGIAAKGVPACLACHGPAGVGNSAAGFAKIAGQHADYTIEALKKYRSKQRTSDVNAIMRDISARLSDEEIAAVSSYIAGLYS